MDNVFQLRLKIDGSPIVPAPTGKGATIREKFDAFHKVNPHVYENMRRIALFERSSGRKRGSIQQITEILRWSGSLTTQGDEYKINNNFTAHYARMLMENEPELVGYFETRAIKAK